ncbi:hypothetical protein K440DRAFT_630440 [Wilcoxina mikolae CBS 423.85]|nr:hypothetical protein K440DRAFT_630440 [Wilcoxina mikolae CBS 423.85]
MSGNFASGDGDGGRVYIVCDALDETDEHNQRQELLPLFHDMKRARFKIFLTSRPHPADVRESFADALQLQLTPKQDDLRRYICGKPHR